ncbi:uncharacterized protein cubi_01256 [Cryptosporidium ubiquitum]|uniref:SAYSvFN domain-containing protein n=1 Tax=Cryptosporidium ubiquitum TaxID=857276 RepID=A0A1J4MDS6_9CRYT|nr:uncharacterized protein cubi_01256 [Cryptosporidium ubiquitum]OII72376.1 hypothetical protein cubi_01256 [Cryptosporidium ubiquitum]
MEDEDISITGYLRKNLFKYLISFLIYILSGYYLGTSGIIIVTIIGLFLNTSSTPRNENQLSAYGILNPGFRRILGDLRLYQLERQLFNRYIESDVEEEEKNDENSKEKYSDDEMNYPISKFSNKKCPKCNSGKKYKKCCALLLKN